MYIPREYTDTYDKGIGIEEDSIKYKKIKQFKNNEMYSQLSNFINEENCDLSSEELASKFWENAPKDIIDICNEQRALNEDSFMKMISKLPDLFARAKKRKGVLI